MVSKVANSHLNPPPRPTGSKGLHRSAGVVTPGPDDEKNKPQQKPQPRQRVKTVKPDGPLKKAARKSAADKGPSSSALRRAAHKQALEQRILDAARLLFAEQGQEAVTLREVAAAVGYSHAMIYSFFADKRALLARLSEEGSLGLQQVLAAQQGSLRGVATAYLHWAVEHPHHYRQLFAQAQGPIYALLRGLFADEPEADLRTQTLWAALHGTALLEIEHSSIESPQPWCALEARIGAMVELLTR